MKKSVWKREGNRRDEQCKREREREREREKYGENKEKEKGDAKEKEARAKCAGDMNLVSLWESIKHPRKGSKVYMQIPNEKQHPMTNKQHPS